jgi:hypothetical protein
MGLDDGLAHRKTDTHAGFETSLAHLMVARP